MNGNAQKLIKYLDGASKRFIIPVYQRNYDWKMEHCKQLYDDLVKIIRQNRKSHFFGSIVSVQSESGTMEEFLIIDGQQRLTTISLLLLAIYHLLSSGKMVILLLDEFDYPPVTIDDVYKEVLEQAENFKKYAG